MSRNKHLTNRSRFGAAVAGLLALFALPGRCQSPSTPLPPLFQWAQEGKAGVGSGFRGLGAKPSSGEAFRRSGRLRVAPARRGERPKSVVLTDFLPPVQDQGEQGSCVGWSTGYYFYSSLVAKQLRLSPDVIRQPTYQFSPAFIYNQSNGGKNEGMAVGDAFKLLKDQGCATLVEMPYREKDFTSQPNDTAKERANRFKARQVVFLYEGRLRKDAGTPDTEALKTFINDTKQPFVTAIPIFKDFPKGKVAAGAVYDLGVEPKKENFFGFHAITVIGYDDNKKAFRMVNSWGPSWGEDGFLWLSEAFLRNWAIDGFTVVPGGAVARDVSGRWTPHITIEEPQAPVGRKTRSNR